MNDVRAPFLRAFAESARLKRLAAGVLVEPFERAAGLMENALQGGRKVLACGNGGSAGDAQHLAAELVNRFEGERLALPAIALTTDGAVLTSIANDDSYERVFARQVEALGAPGDVLVAISTSGRSPSVLRAVEVARTRGLAIIALAGKDGGGLPALLGPEDVFLTVPEDRTARIQEVHLLLIHCLCERMDAAFGVAPLAQPGPSGTAAKIHRDWTTLRAAAGRFRPLVFTNGVFDILHRGHVSYLEEARALGACLVVGVNDDDSVRRLGKGPDRPVNPLEDRMALLAALEAVDFVVPFSEDTPQELIEFLAPDVLVKGGDWPPQQIVGADFVLGRGGRVYAIPFAFERSTTGLLRRVRGEQT